MNISKEKKITLIHSVIWAVLMLVLAFLLKGNEQITVIFSFMVGGWYVSHASILKQARINKSNDDSTKNSKMCCL